MEVGVKVPTTYYWTHICQNRANKTAYSSPIWLPTQSLTLVVLLNNNMF